MKIYMSGLARVMDCAGSLFLDKIEDEDKTKRDEGTAAGEYLERVLTLKTAGVTHARNGVLFDDDMKHYAIETANKIIPLAATPIECETRVNWTTRSGIELAGRLDVSFIDHNNCLYIDDYKYGWGLVEPEQNWQLIAYGIGEVLRQNRAFQTIVMRIHQPRPHHEAGSTREWRLTYDQLLKQKELIETRMDEIAAGEKGLATGPECKYCPSAVNCVAFNKAYHRGVEVIHEYLQDNLDERELSFQLDLVERVEELVKTRRSSLEQLCVSRIKEGKVVPNYVVEPRYGNRSWTSVVSPDFVKALTGKDITETVILSPAKAEKIGVPKDFVEQVTERKFLGSKPIRKDHNALGDKIFGVSNGS